MPKAKNLPEHEPKQQRSRETLDRLLAATIKILDEEGLEGAVIPKIAAAAKVAPASVYRRFVDKDALLRAAFLHMLRKSNELNRELVGKALLRKTLEESAVELMNVLFDQYKRHPRLLRASAKFLETDTDPDFSRDARLHVAENISLVVDALLAFRVEIEHRFPRRALQFAVLTAASAIEGYALEPSSMWHVMAPVSEKELKAELARTFVAYLRHR